jgi:hypothetical protein
MVWMGDSTMVRIGHDITCNTTRTMVVWIGRIRIGFSEEGRNKMVAELAERESCTHAHTLQTFWAFWAALL